MRDALDMSGTVIVVTGGGRGVGRGISERFLEAGASVVVCGRREPETLPSAAEGQVEFVAADVRDVDQIDRVVSTTLDRHRRLDVLVNNAGGSPTADSATASPRFASSVLNLNLLASLNFARLCYFDANIN